MPRPTVNSTTARRTRREKDGARGGTSRPPHGTTRPATWLQRRSKHSEATDRTAIAWSNEHAPDPATIMVLDPPLPRSGIHDAVEVELYSTMIDDDGASHMDQCARELVLKVWWPSIEKAKAPVSLTHRLVDEGPGLDSRYHESRRRIAELVIGGAWYMNQDDERGLTVIRRTLEHLQTHKVREFTETDIKEILTAPGIERGEWEGDAKAQIDTARTRANARWAHLAEQYLDRLGRTARTAAPLGRDASPIIVVDGRYLMTMNTIGEQGGLKTSERLFQTVNSLIRKQLELHNNGERRAMMNYTAATLMAAAVALGGCVPNQQGRRNRHRTGSVSKVEVETGSRSCRNTSRRGPHPDERIGNGAANHLPRVARRRGRAEGAGVSPEHHRRAEDTMLVARRARPAGRPKGNDRGRIPHRVMQGAQARGRTMRSNTLSPELQGDKGRVRTPVTGPMAIPDKGRTRCRSVADSSPSKSARGTERDLERVT